MRYSLRFPVLASVVLLTSCGGGGGGGGGPGDSAPTALLTAANGSEACAEVSKSMTSTGGGGVTPLSIGDGAHGWNLGGFALDQLRRIPDPSVVRPQHHDDGTSFGSFSGTATTVHNGQSDPDAPAPIGAGDSYQFTWTNYNDGNSADDVTLTGTAMIAIWAAQWSAGDLVYLSATFTMNLTVTLQGDTLSLAGALSISGGTNGPTTSMHIEFSNFQANLGGASVTIQSATMDYSETDDGFDVTFSWTSSGILMSSALAGTVSWSTPEPFTGLVDAPPEAGVLVIRGGHNASVRLTATGGGDVRIEVDEDGDGTYESTTYTTWDSI